MSPSAKQEVVDYLNETISLFKKLRSILDQKNKTTKTKGMASIIQITEARLKASADYIKSGGYELFPLVMQKSLYDPILEWLINEIE